MWADAVEKLAGIGRVIAYDRRGCARSERPEPYERTSVAEHADDAAALLDALGATPAIVIGRSYGGTVAIDLALRYPDRVRALVAAGAGRAARARARRPPRGWMRSRDRLRAGRGARRRRRRRRGADHRGGRRGRLALVSRRGAAGARRQRARRSSRSSTGEWWLEADAAATRHDRPQPALLVAAADSPPEFHEPIEAMADALPNARSVLVGGGHLIDPAAPEVLAFIEEVLGQPQADIASASAP